MSALLAACASSATPSAPTPTHADSSSKEDEGSTEGPIPEFEFQGATAIIPNGEPDHWTGKYMNPGGIVRHEELFHMFVNAFHDWPGTVSIGFYISPDGYTWERAQDEPIFTSDNIPFVKPGQGADVSSALVMPDGTWVLYFHIVGSNAAGIGRAIAPSPEGPWSFDETPVLTPGAEGEWDARAVSWPNVIATDDGVCNVLFGFRQFWGPGNWSATSPDGIIWTKYNDPGTSEPPFAESDPVIIGSGSWDLSKADRPRSCSYERRVGNDLHRQYPE
ncbi:MAG: hypothetical protein ACRDFQ_08445 [Anaerolineales bacterium]